MSDAAVVGGVTMVPKEGVTDTLVNWLLPGEYFVSRDSDYNYGKLMVDFFKPELFATESGQQDGNFARQWYGLNSYAAYPENGGVMITPVSWFKDSARFGFSDMGVIVELSNAPKSGNSIYWILAAFAAVALASKGA